MIAGNTTEPRVVTIKGNTGRTIKGNTRRQPCIRVVKATTWGNPRQSCIMTRQARTVTIRSTQRLTVAPTAMHKPHKPGPLRYLTKKSCAR